ncbi:hypothetical protein BO86DRAFT_248921 [Aspergillus japonicus CBS 114.51]|uniref:Uncharacterized protein n=1 Tax=Aspergillus japonicus CBS 114.51 TaxID=1448312 RepID=A0A8T8WLM1_ASPJA|nr:hypothetical protein BO86DRAFT_248921 [Aspergillus japonicus CBS 114.51]RAH76594.1 hypothetical protein BO86DRAFT_248921 [Aspergillus japonicus CBS 114.51]
MMQRSMILRSFVGDGMIVGILWPLFSISGCGSTGSQLKLRKRTYCSPPTPRTRSQGDWIPTATLLEKPASREPLVYCGAGPNGPLASTVRTGHLVHQSEKRNDCTQVPSAPAFPVQHEIHWLRW